MPTKTTKKASKPDAMDVARRKLAATIAATLTTRKLTQNEAARLMKDAPSQVSLVVTGKLRGFSTERLMRMLNGLGHDVEIRLRKSKATKGRTSVAA